MTTIDIKLYLQQNLRIFPEGKVHIHPNIPFKQTQFVPLPFFYKAIIDLFIYLFFRVSYDDQRENLVEILVSTRVLFNGASVNV